MLWFVKFYKIYTVLKSWIDGNSIQALTQIENYFKSVYLIDVW